MAISTIDRVETRACFLLVVVASFGCLQTPAQDKARSDSEALHPPASPKSSAPPPAVLSESPAPTAPSTTRSVEITQFDCSKQEDFRPGGQVEPPQMLSQWRAGGPSGASWNASDLKCWASIRVECARGEVRAELLVGQRAMNARRVAINTSGAQHLDFDVPERAWRGGLDPVRKPALPYRTALFTLRAEVSCEEPEAFSPAVDRYADIADVRSFIAGFAGGE